MSENVQGVVVIGAGIAGLCAAREVAAAGLRVRVLEKSRGIGGRMATRRVGAAVCDHGAQFFTVRGDDFAAVVTAARRDAAVATWCDGFAQMEPDGSLVAAGDGHPRWRGSRGMTDLPKWLAEQLAAAGGRCEIRTQSTVKAVATVVGGVRIEMEDGTGGRGVLFARGAILTAPVPQVIELMAAGGMLGAGGGADAAACAALATVAYDPCFALMLTLNRPSRVPPPGGIQFAAGQEPIAWLADNFQKGVSPVPALTVHATGAFSRDHFAAPPEEVARMLLDAARPWIDGNPATTVVEHSLHRWKFALPTTLIPEPLVVVSAAPPVACCGDAFAGPRVEGAAASGLAAGRWMLRALA
jgi:predicted NAD/FAD-dependent oxidoreductase